MLAKCLATFAVSAVASSWCRTSGVILMLQCVRTGHLSNSYSKQMGKLITRVSRAVSSRLWSFTGASGRQGEAVFRSGQGGPGVGTTPEWAPESVDLTFQVHLWQLTAYVPFYAYIPIVPTCIMKWTVMTKGWCLQPRVCEPREQVSSFTHTEISLNCWGHLHTRADMRRHTKSALCSTGSVDETEAEDVLQLTTEEVEA